jgi:Fe2+ or Zn2+ uptake regulation protein
MSLLTDVERSFSEFLEKRDLKLTTQRRTILHQALRDGHFSAEELLKSSKEEDPTVSKATVYRTLALLKESKSF